MKNYRKKGQKSYSNLSVFHTPKYIFISGPGILGTSENLIKTIEISPKKLVIKIIEKKVKVPQL
jgi:hypothetical protein